MADEAVSLYLDLLKRCVSNLIYQDPAVPYVGEPAEGQVIPFSLERRLAGKDWPLQAHTMIGVRRLDNVQHLVEDVLRNGVPGDLIETGVWRGGSTIFMRGVLKAHGITDRSVWVADSFTGVYPARHEHGATEKSYTTPGVEFLALGEAEYPQELTDKFALLTEDISYEAVRDRFARYDLLDEQVKFLPGWFSETLPTAPIERLALLRLDGDFYDATRDALTALYPKLSPGGWAIVDDYGTFSECRQAVHDYLDEKNIEVEIIPIDDEAVYWQKQG
jgi:Macrocin-O-methyltransferase (TylF)